MSNRIQPIEDSSKTISNLAQERIRAAILAGTLPPGSRIDQNQLAKDLNTSLVPVREALKKLESEGFVQIIPRRGAFITEVSVQDMEDLYYARSILEGQTAFHAVEHLTGEHLTRLEKLYHSMGTALETHNYDEFTRLNRQFHFLIYDAAGSKYLSRMIVGLWELAERYRYRYMFYETQADSIQSEHLAILEACRARDGQALQQAVIHHTRRTLAGLKILVEQHQSGQE
jgi:DNA-binding GntR family transcriptional regulator